MFNHEQFAQEIRDLNGSFPEVLADEDVFVVNRWCERALRTFHDMVDAILHTYFNSGFDKYPDLKSLFYDFATNPSIKAHSLMGALILTHQLKANPFDGEVSEGLQRLLTIIEQKFYDVEKGN